MDYAGNTRKEREKSEKKQRPEKEKIEKVVSGEVVQKPKGVGRKFKETFFGGDAKHAAGFVVSDVLLPALRNLIVDAITKGVENLIYGQTNRRRPTPYDSRYQGGVQYNRPVLSDPRSRDPRPALMPMSARGRQNRHEINDVVIGTKEEAELVVERLVDILDKYEVVALADLYDLLGLQTSHIDNKWGWTYLGNVQVRQIRQGYLLELPPLEEI